MSVCAFDVGAKGTGIEGAVVVVVIVVVVVVRTALIAKMIQYGNTQEQGSAWSKWP